MILAPSKNRYVSMICAMRRRNSAPITLPIAVVMALLFALMGTGDFTMAQDIVGRMSGTVTDSQGAVVPDARVTIKNEATGVSRPPISTNGAGFYVADALPNQEVENVPLNLDAKLDIGTVTETVSNTIADINGLRLDGQNWSVDGGWNLDAGSNNSVFNEVGIDFIQEVDVQSSNYDSEFGRS